MHRQLLKDKNAHWKRLADELLSTLPVTRVRCASRNAKN